MLLTYLVCFDVRLRRNAFKTCNLNLLLNALFSPQEDRYGTGSVRSLNKFFETFGIDVTNKRVEHHLCTFVQGGQMHKDFQKHLRPDGMGIDYSKIDYKFKDPAPSNKHDVLE